MVQILMSIYQIMDYVQIVNYVTYNYEHIIILTYNHRLSILYH